MSDDILASPTGDGQNATINGREYYISVRRASRTIEIQIRQHQGSGAISARKRWVDQPGPETIWPAVIDLNDTEFSNILTTEETEAIIDWLQVAVDEAENLDYRITTTKDFAVKWRLRQWENMITWEREEATR